MEGVDQTKSAQLECAFVRAQVPALNTFTALEELSLDSCTLLTQLQLLLPRLQRASLRGCPALATVRFPQPES